MAHILGIGIATLDVILTVETYPQEDTKTRALARRTARGGNAANTLVVLSRLGHRCTWAGAIADNQDGDFVLSDLRHHRVETLPRRAAGNHDMPTSYVLVSQRNGSRTIVHHRNLPEFSHHDFSVIELDGFDWLHFEGRNVVETQEMLAAAAKTAPQARLSVEIERHHPGIEALFENAHLLIFSREYVRYRGFDQADDFLSAISSEAPAIDLICTWGDAGAFAIDRQGRQHHSPAFPPVTVVDTLGAGDAFNAGLIDAQLRGWELSDCLTHACRIAGSKCGINGLDFVDSLH